MVRDMLKKVSVVIKQKFSFLSEAFHEKLDKRREKIRVLDEEDSDGEVDIGRYHGKR